MPSLGNLWYQLSIKDLTDADLQKINAKLKNIGFDITLTPKILKDLTQSAVPKGIKIELDPTIKNEALARAVEGKVMRVAVTPLLTGFREAIVRATRENPPQAEVGVSAERLRTIIQSVLSRHGFMINISTVNDNYSKAIQAKLNGTTYKVKIHADANEITRSMQASLMQVQSRYFGLKVSRDILYRSIDEALGQKRFNINIAVSHDQARKAVQDALLRAQVMGKDQALAYQRLQTGEMRAAQAELLRLKAAHGGAADAAKVHASASLSLGGAMGSNIKIAGELGSAMASMYSIHAVKEFLSQVIEIGGELEHQKIAMDTIFGDKGKTNELFGQIKGLARQSPFGVMELTSSVKQLSAYGVEYNEIYDTAKRLADISAATSVDINRLILAFGKTKSRGFLDGLEAKQFAYANIPIYEMVRKKLEELEGQAVTTADVMARMKKREISFDIVKDVLWDITDPGGKFYNMQEALAGSVKTSWKLVKDNIELMFGEIAESSVGGALKSIAEVLQSLTRNWKTLGAVLAGVAVTFGIYKAAVAASNAMMGTANSLAVQKALASNKVAAANALEAETYRLLTFEEDYAILTKSGLAKLNRSLMLSHRELTAAEWDAVIASKAVNSDYILRRIALGRLTGAEVRYLVTSGAISVADARRALAARRLRVSLASLWLMMKKMTIGNWFANITTGVSANPWKNVWTNFQTSLKGVQAKFTAAMMSMKTSWASFTTSVKGFTWAGFFTGVKTGFRSVIRSITHAEIGVTRLKLAMSGIGRAIANIGAFIFSPATMIMAAVGGLMYMWQKNNEEMEKAKEIGSNIFTKASEGADNLQKKIDEIKPSKGLSTAELNRGIEDMENAIKDYSPTPLHDINEALYTQEGLLRPIQERYDILKKKLEELKGAFDAIENKNIGGAVENAINDTNEGILDDDINKNAKDYDEALKKREDAIRKFTAQYPQYVRKAVADISKSSQEFRTATADMNTDAQKISYFIKNLDKYGEEVKSLPSVSNVLKSQIGAWRLDSGFGIEKSWNTLLDDMQTFWESIETDAAQNGIPSIQNATNEVKEAYAISIKNWISGLEVSDETKQQMFNFYSELLKFDFETFDAEGAIADTLDKGLEAEVGKVIYQKVKNGLKLTPEEQSKVQAALEKLYLEMFAKAPEAQKMALNNAIATADKDGNLFFDKGKEMKIVAKLNVRADWDEWQREIDDATGNLEPIQTWVKGAADIPSFIKAAQEGYSEAKKTIDKFKSLKLSASIGFDFAGLKAIPLVSKQFADASPLAQQMIIEWNKAVDTINAAKKAGSELGFDPTAEYNKGHKNKGKKGSDKDPFAEAIKERLNLLKRAKSEYESLAKILGTEGASKELADSPIFAGLKANKFLPEQAIPKTLDDYEKELDKLQKQLTAKGLKKKKHRELNIEIEEVKLNIKKKKIEEGLKLALDKVSKEAERQLADWNLFDKIRKATGNQNLAMSIAFGMNVKTETDYPTMIKQQLKKTVDTAEAALSKVKPKKGESPYEAQGYNYDTLKKLYDARDTEEGMQAWTAVPEEIRKAWEKANGDILKYFDQQREAVANILNEYQTLQDKIAAINAKRNLALETINAKDEQGNYILSDDERAKRSKTVNIKADYELFTQSNDYLRFFNNIYGLTMDEANRIGDLIQLNLNQRLQDAQISAYDYEKEMEKVRKQLEALRNVKSDAMTFLTGGLKGLNQKRLQKAEGKLANNEDYQKALADQIAAQNALNKAQEEGDEKAIEAAEAQLALANQSVKAFTKIRDAIIADQEKMQNVLDVANIASNIAGGMSDAFNSIRDMADAYGVDTESGAWEDIAAVMDTLTAVTEGVQKVVQSAMNGDIGGILSGVVSTITSPFTIWSKLHDKKLQKLIDRSKEAAQIMQNQYDILEKRMANFLGNAANMKVEGYDGEGGAYGKQRELMEGQLAELEKQRQAEIDKKKTDKSVVEDYNKQIEEMKISIRDFALEAAKDIYGIDLNGWAEQLGDSLVDAFAKGEDAAEAFDKTVGDILRDLTSKMISQDILAPMFGDLRDFLFGENGMSGAFGADFKLDASEVAAMKEYLDKIKNQGIPAAEELFDAINEATGGLLDNTDKAKDGLSAGIQNITEDTADLLASYVNGVRGDVALEVHDYWPKLLEMVPQFNVIAQSQLDAQRQIAENTLRNAIAAETIVKSNNDISRLLVRVTQGGAKFYVN